MRKFSSELGHNYETYTFGYCNYCALEEGDSLRELYAQGYLPYSGAVDAPHTLYMARHARVLLSQFELSSENRRIAKKFDGKFKKEYIPYPAFRPDEAFYAFCLSYFKARHGNTMPRERLEFILQSPFITHIVRYSEGAHLVGYALVMREKDMEHYWFSFYDLSLARQSLGLWLMLDCLREAKQAGLAHYYLGTVYGEKALYKTNFEPLEWWSGENWNNDTTLLRERARADALRITALSDEWKSSKKPFVV